MARGFNSHTLIYRASSVGAIPSGVDYNKLPFESINLGGEQGNVSDNQAGNARKLQDQFDDVVNVSGQLTGYLDPRYFGFILTGLLGDPTTTGTTDYTHTFDDGATSLPDYAIEVADKTPGVYRMHNMCMFNTLNITQQPKGGPAMFTADILAQGSTKGSSTSGGTPVEQTFDRFSNFQGTLKIGGSAAANILSADISYNNNLTGEWDVGSTGELSEILLGQPTLSGKLSTRFANSTLLDDALAGTRIAIELAWAIDSNTSLTLTIPQAKLAVPKPSISGPGGYGLDFTWNAEYNDADSCGFEAVLKNDLDGTLYA
ncbi:MAG: hypothetical protein GC153_13100 [Alphaproteobacteria bacterium]|nr:hypothetical protein [Alphaproteobacteria bacterium]